MTTQEFCTLHLAPPNYQAQITAHPDLQEAWLHTPPHVTIWMATRPGVLPASQLRAFAVWCARRLEHYMEDSRTLGALMGATLEAVGHPLAVPLDSYKDAAREARHLIIKRYKYGTRTHQLRAAAAAMDCCEADPVTAAQRLWRTPAVGESETEGRHLKAQWLRENTTPDFGN